VYWILLLTSEDARVQDHFYAVKVIRDHLVVFFHVVVLFSSDKTVPRLSVQSSVFTPIVNKNDSVVTPIVNKNGKPDIIYKLCIKLVIANNMIVLSTHYKHNWIQATLEEYLF